MAEESYEVVVNNYVSTCLFYGCKVKPDDEYDNNINNICSFLFFKRNPVNYFIEEIVGIHSKTERKWVRGQIIEVRPGDQFLVFLLDCGKFETVKKDQIVNFPDNSFTYPPKFEKFGLYGVLSAVELCRGSVALLDFVLDQGTLFFTEKKRHQDLIFGDITVKPKDKSEPINLTSYLLSKGLVRTTNDFENDIQTIYEVSDSNHEGSFAEEPKIKNFEQCNKIEMAMPTSVNTSSTQAHRAKKEISSYRSSHSTTSKTGSLRTPDKSNAEENPLFYPANFHYKQKKKSEPERWKPPDVVRLLTTYRSEAQNTTHTSDEMVKKSKDKSQCEDEDEILRNKCKAYFKAKPKIWGEDDHVESEHESLMNARTKPYDFSTATVTNDKIEETNLLSKNINSNTTTSEVENEGPLNINAGSCNTKNIAGAVSNTSGNSEECVLNKIKELMKKKPSTGVQPNQHLSNNKNILKSDSLEETDSANSSIILKQPPNDKSRVNLNSEKKYLQNSSLLGVNNEVDERKLKEKIFGLTEEELSMGMGKIHHSPFLPSSEKEDTINRLNANGILLFSKTGRIVRPIYTCNEAALDPTVKKGLDNKFNMRELNRIQRISFPTILAGENIAMITHRRSDGTAGFVIPLASYLLDPERYLQFRTGNGPLAIIICSSWSTADEVADMFKRLTTCVKVILTYGGGAETENKVELLNGCDVLVSTPRCLLRLLDCGLTNLKRLHHLVLDDADVLLDKFKPEVESLLQKVDMMHEERESKGLVVKIQAIITALRWTSPVQELVTKFMVDATLCITNVLESCVYAGIKPLGIFQKKDKKLEKLIEILKKVNSKKRVVVMCNNKEDVQQVYNVLHELHEFKLLAAHEDLTYVNISELPSSWHKNDSPNDELWKNFKPIMIRSDEVLEDVPISNAEVLIHYNMPNTHKTFSLRFSCLLSNFPDLLKPNSQMSRSIDCEVYILMDEENCLEVPSIISFFRRLGNLPKTIEKTIEDIEKIKEENKINKPICEDLKQFGECWNVKDCPERHIFSTTVDCQEQHVPQTGYVKMSITFVHNSCHYSARLLEHSTNKRHWRKLNQDRIVFQTKLLQYYNIMKNRKLHGIPSVGDMVAIEVIPGEFDRAVVLEITYRNKRGEPEAVNIRAIDDGRYFNNYGVIKLYHLPDELKGYAPGAVDVYLCGLLPKDCDTSWSPAMTHWVDRIFRAHKQMYENGCILGKIQLCVGQNLWLDPVECVDCLQTDKSTVVYRSLRRELLMNNNAIKNPDHLLKLRKLCDKAGIQLPVVEKAKVKKPTQAKPTWAWLPSDELETVNVKLIQSTDLIFVSIAKFFDSLEKLENELEEFAKGQSGLKSCSELDIGDIYMSKSAYGWNRAMVRKKPTDNEVEVLYVDHGDVATVPCTDIVPISDELITKLSFQAIECYLAGVQFSKHDDEITDQISDFTRNEEQCYLDLQIKVCNIEPVATITGGRRYKVILLDQSNNIIINDKIITLGLGERVDEDHETLEKCKELLVVQEKEDDCNKNEERSSEPVQVVTTIHEKDNSKIIFPAEFDPADAIRPEEYNQRVLKLLEDIENNKFDISTVDFEQLNGSSPLENDRDKVQNKNESQKSICAGPFNKSVSPNITYDSRNSNNDINQSTSVCSIMTPSSKSSLLSINGDNQESSIVQSNEICVYKPHLQDPAVSKDLTQVLDNNCPLTPLTTKVEESSHCCSADRKLSEVGEKSNLKYSDRENIPQAQSSPQNYSTATGTSFLDISPVNAANLSDHDCNSQKDNSFSPSANSSGANLKLLEKVKPFLAHLSPSNFNQNITLLQSNDFSYVNNTVTETPCQETNMDDTNGTKPNGSFGQDSFGEPSCFQKSTETVSESDDSNGSQVTLMSQTHTDHGVPPCEYGECNVQSDLGGEIKVDQTPNTETSSPTVTMHPFVLWHQDTDNIWLSVQLPDLKELTLNCDPSNISFRAIHNNKIYAFHIELWGAHLKENMKAQNKGRHFEIKLEKVLKGKKRYIWPRLTKSENKLRWLKLNIEIMCQGVTDTEDEDKKPVPFSFPLWKHDTDSESVGTESNIASDDMSDY